MLRDDQLTINRSSKNFTLLLHLVLSYKHNSYPVFQKRKCVTFFVYKMTMNLTNAGPSTLARIQDPTHQKRVSVNPSELLVRIEPRLSRSCKLTSYGQFSQKLPLYLNHGPTINISHDSIAHLKMVLLIIKRYKNYHLLNAFGYRISGIVPPPPPPNQKKKKKKRQ